MDVNKLAGTRFGNYELKSLAGRGGMSVVYRAVQRDIEREVALKIFTKAIQFVRNDIDQFMQEARLAAHLDHPHVVSIYDFGFENETAFVVMRFLHGGTLAERLYAAPIHNEPLPDVQMIAPLVMQVSRAIYHAHTKGVIHRDIKPDNIMFDERGTPFVVDFGVATMVDVARVHGDDMLLIGTPAYMAPEQWRGHTITPLTDQYALGLVFYELLTGKRAMDAQSMGQYKYQHLNYSPPPAHELREGIPEAISAVLQKAFAREPDRRFPTVLKFAEAFQAALTGLHLPEKPATFFTFKLWNTDAYHPGDVDHAKRKTDTHPAVSVASVEETPPEGHDNETEHTRPSELDSQIRQRQSSQIIPRTTSRTRAVHMTGESDSPMRLIIFMFIGVLITLIVLGVLFTSG